MSTSGKARAWNAHGHSSNTLQIAHVQRQCAWGHTLRDIRRRVLFQNHRVWIVWEVQWYIHVTILHTRTVLWWEEAGVIFHAQELQQGLDAVLLQGLDRSPGRIQQFVKFMDRMVQLARSFRMLEES